MVWRLKELLFAVEITKLYYSTGYIHCTCVSTEKIYDRYPVVLLFCSMVIVPHSSWKSSLRVGNIKYFSTYSGTPRNWQDILTCSTETKGSANDPTLKLIPYTRSNPELTSSKEQYRDLLVTSYSSCSVVALTL